jgi:hypothetical protein
MNTLNKGTKSKLLHKNFLGVCFTEHREVPHLCLFFEQSQNTNKSHALFLQFHLPFGTTKNECELNR